MLNILIPMAGRGSRFQREGYTLPKPLIPVHGKPMIQVVLDNLKPEREHRFIFMCLKEHIDDYQIDKQLSNLVLDHKIVVVDKVTEGAACTALLAREYINNDDALMIANSDQWVDININDYLSAIDEKGVDGLIMTMWADHPKWSYVKIGSDKCVTEVVEKKVVSNEATVGIYNYKRGMDFVEAAELMIRKDLRVNNEFYVAPVYNEMILAEKKVIYYNVGKVGCGMYGMGVPDDLKHFESTEISKKAIL